LVVSIFLGYHFVSKVNHPPFIPPKPLFGEHLQHKPMESVFAYILTTDKVIITKLHRNIKQVKYYIIVYSYGTKGAWPRSRDPLLNFETPSISQEWLKLET